MRVIVLWADSIWERGDKHCWIFFSLRNTTAHAFLVTHLNTFVCVPLGFKPFSSSARRAYAVNVWKAAEIRTALFVLVIGINQVIVRSNDYGIKFYTITLYLIFLKKIILRDHWKLVYKIYSVCIAGHEKQRFEKHSYKRTYYTCALKSNQWLLTKLNDYWMRF